MIDTLCYNHFNANNYYAGQSYGDYYSILIYWKVRNVGDVAESKDMIRGEIIKTDSKTHKERTSFQGPHFVECYIIKDNVCVARDRIDVPIGRI